MSKSPSFSFTRRGVNLFMLSSTMFKFIKNLILDFNEVEKELNKQGIFNFVTIHGVWTAFVDNDSLTTQINKVDDRQDTISK
jgi:hypothetical protein